MIFNTEFFLAIIWISLFINILLVLFLVLRRLEKEQQEIQIYQRQNQIMSIISGKLKKWKYGKSIESYVHFQQHAILGDEERRLLEKNVIKKASEKKAIKRLKSFSKIKRIQASTELAIIKSEKGRIALEKSLLEERDFPVKLYFANALSDVGDKRSLPALVESLINAHYWYRNKVNMLICSFNEDLLAYLPALVKREDLEIKDLIITFSMNYIAGDLKDYLLKQVNRYETDLKRITGEVIVSSRKSCSTCIYGKQKTKAGFSICPYMGVVVPTYHCRRYKIYPSSLKKAEMYKQMIYHATEVLSKNYYKELDKTAFYSHKDPVIRNIAVESLHSYNSAEKFELLIDFLGDDVVSESAMKGIRKVLSRNASFVRNIYDRALVEGNQIIQSRLIELLSNKIEYLIMKLIHGQRENGRRILKEIIIEGETSQFISFMNENTDKIIEEELIQLVKESVTERPDREGAFVKYLDKRFVAACGLISSNTPEPKRVEIVDRRFIRIMYALVITIILAFPIAYIIGNWEELLLYDFYYHLRNFIISFNYLLVFYSLVLNAVFVGLLVLSVKESEKQIHLWNLKSIKMLFKKNMLPTVSIIAPAHNEENTIVESVNSLLNLKYPSYELIVVNDGSKDKTLEILVKKFELSRVDFHYAPRLKTMPIKGVYMNPSQPKLIIVDKENGGKADALNAGINVSKYEYFCGIDADSLLEDEALLKLASLTLDTGYEMPALGGNVLPVNGCTVDKGLLTDINIPKKMVARLQTVEYVRSFMTGRLGWAAINCMLIISGAFGLFRKERIVGIGGYLTSKERYGKDTVGEDMEMVVRTRRLMYENKLKHKVSFAFDANCWTQVPENNKNLKAQRQRWSRGLADTMTFHRKMILNPLYGKVGMLAMPFFFIFELAGPIIEIEGYFMVLLAFLFGYLDIQIALMLFVTTVLLGVFVSMSSFMIMGKSSVHFKTKDVLKLTWFCVIENFGPRQMASFWRTDAIFKLLRGRTEWEKIDRSKFISTEERGEVKG